MEQAVENRRKIVEPVNARTWSLIVILMIFLSSLRGIRYPGAWAYSHYLFNYNYGFVKRSLIGEIVGLVGNIFFLSYNFFFFFSIGIFILNAILIFRLSKDFIASSDTALLSCAIVFSSSMALVFLSHSVGYGDNIELLLTLLSLCIRSFYRKLCFLSLAMPVLLLVHEATLVVFFPVIFMSLVFCTDFCKKQILLLVLFSALTLVISLVASSATLSELAAGGMYLELRQKVGLPLRTDAFETLHRNNGDNLQIMRESWSDYKRYVSLILSLSVTAPTFLFITYTSIQILRRNQVKIYLMVLSFLASLSPLVMHIFAWDIGRWNTLSITTSYLMLYIIHSSKRRGTPIGLRRKNYPAIVALVFLNGMSSVTLFDDHHVNNLPFIQHFEFLFDVIKGIEKFPSYPRDTAN